MKKPNLVVRFFNIDNFKEDIKSVQKSLTKVRADNELLDSIPITTRKKVVSEPEFVAAEEADDFVVNEFDITENINYHGEKDQGLLKLNMTKEEAEAHVKEVIDKCKAEEKEKEMLSRKNFEIQDNFKTFDTEIFPHDQQASFNPAPKLPQVVEDIYKLRYSKSYF